MLGFWAFTAIARIQPLVSELRSSKPCSSAKINKYRIKIAVMGACCLWGMGGSGLRSKKTDNGSSLWVPSYQQTVVELPSYVWLWRLDFFFLFPSFNAFWWVAFLFLLLLDFFGLRLTSPRFHCWSVELCAYFLLGMLMCGVAFPPLPQWRVSQAVPLDVALGGCLQPFAFRYPEGTLVLEVKTILCPQPCAAGRTVIFILWR